MYYTKTTLYCKINTELRNTKIITAYASMTVILLNICGCRWTGTYAIYVISWELILLETIIMHKNL